MAKMGRPSKVKTIRDNIEQIKEWKKLGVSDEQIARQLHIGKSTYYKLMKENPDLYDKMREGVEVFIIDLKKELAYKAKKHTLETRKQYIKKDLETGHSTQYTEITTKEVDGDLGAIHLLLKNLDKENWFENWAMYDLKKQELELRKQMAENQF